MIFSIIKASQIALFALAALIATPLFAKPPSGYEEVWRDDFDYQTDSQGHVDFRGNWSYHPPEATRWKDGDGFNTADAASIESDSDATDGKALSLKVFTDPSQPAGQQHRAAAISTFDYSNYQPETQEWIYGYFEARIKYPATESGSWSSFWLFDFDWDNENKQYFSYKGQTEIDILEFREHLFGTPLPQTQFFSNLHFGWSSTIGLNTQEQASRWKDLDFNPREFHTIGLLWTKDGYDIFLDDEFVHSLPGKVTVYKNDTETTEVDILFNGPHAMFLSTEMRPGWTGQAPADGFGTRDNPKTEMVIDYVAVYQKPGESPQGRNRWALHPSLRWLYDAGKGWFYSASEDEWFFLVNQQTWAWSEDGGWHWTGTEGWVYRLQDEKWLEFEL